jgi:hypothetical protein
MFQTNMRLFLQHLQHETQTDGYISSKWQPSTNQNLFKEKTCVLKMDNFRIAKAGINI